MTGQPPKTQDPLVGRVMGALQDRMRQIRESGKSWDESAIQAAGEFDTLVGSDTFRDTSNALSQYLLTGEGEMPDLESPEGRLSWRPSPEDFEVPDNAFGWLYSNVVSPVGNIIPAGLQVTSDLVTGITGQEKFDVKANLQAATRKAFFSDDPYDYLVDEAQAKSEAVRQSSGVVSRVANDAGAMVGHIAGLFGMGPGSWVVNAGKKITGELAKRFAGRELPRLAQQAVELAGGLGLYGGITAEGQRDEQGDYQAPGMDERLKGAALGAVTGMVMPLIGEAGKRVGQWILKRGVDASSPASKHFEAMLKWAQDNNMAKPPNMSAQDYGRALASKWLEAGTPGASMPFSRMAALAAQSGVEGVGFSLLDTAQWGDLMDAFVEGDGAAFARAMERVGSSALGIMALHAGGRLRDIPGWQRQSEPSPRNRFRPEEGGRAQDPQPKPDQPSGGAPQLPDTMVRLGWQAKEVPAQEGMPADLAQQDLYQVEVDGTPFSFTIQGDIVRPNEAMRRALGSPETMGTEEFYQAVQRAHLFSALQSKALLPGTEIDASGIFAEPTGEGQAPVERTILFGRVYERPMGSDVKWKPAQLPAPREAEELNQEQRQAVERLAELPAVRPDLLPEYRPLLDGIITVLSTRAEETDAAVADALGMLEQGIIQPDAPPEQLAEGIEALAKIVTTTGPEQLAAEAAGGPGIFGDLGGGGEVSPETEAWMNERREGGKYLSELEQWRQSWQRESDEWQRWDSRRNEAMIGIDRGKVGAEAVRVQAEIDRLREADETMPAEEFNRRMDALEKRLFELDMEGGERRSPQEIASAKDAWYAANPQPERFETLPGAPPPPKKPVSKRPIENVGMVVVPASEVAKIARRYDDDGYLYHVTSRENAQRILREGIKPGSLGSGQFSAGALREASKGKVFLTDVGNVERWINKMEANYEAETGEDAEGRFVAVRLFGIPDDRLMDDEVGNRDVGGAGNFYVESDILPAGPIEQYGGIPGSREVGEAVKFAGRVAGKVADIVERPYAESLVSDFRRRLEEAGEPTEKASQVWDALTRSKRIASELDPIRKEAQQIIRSTRRGFGRTSPELNRKIRIPESQGYLDVWHVALDTDAAKFAGEDLGDLSEQASQAIGKGREITRTLRRMASERGMKVELPGGEFAEIAAKRDKDVLVRQGTQELRNIMDLGRGKAWDALSQVLADWNEGMTLKEVEDKLNEARVGLKRRDSIEVARVFKHFPSGITVDGKDIQLLETDPKRHIDQMIERAAQRFGVVEILGQDLPKSAEEGGYEPSTPGPVPYREWIAEIRDPDAQVAAERAIRALHGIPITPPVARWGLDPTSELGKLARIGEMYMGLWGALKMGMAFTANPIEPWATPAAQLGFDRIAYGKAQVWKAILDGSIVDLVDRAARKGFFHRDLSDWAVTGEGIEKAAQITRNIGQLSLALFEISQRYGAELPIGLAAERMVEEMREGRGRTGDVLFAQRFGFSREEAEAMARGEGTDEQYDRVLFNAVSTLAGGRGQNPAEKSRFAHSRIFPRIIKFTGYFQKQAQSFRSHIDALARDPKTGLPSLVAFMLANTISGLTIDGVRRLVGSGPEGVAQYWRELLDNPDRIALFALTSSLLGGPGAALAEWIKGLFGDEEVSVKDVGQGIAPIAAVMEQWDFWSAMFAEHADIGDRNPYSRYNGTSAVEKVGLLAEQLSPLLRRVGEGLFGINAIAIGRGNPDIRDAVRAHWRWMRGNTDIQFSGRGGGVADPEEREKQLEALAEMRNVAAEIQDGTAWSDEEVKASLRKALKLRGSDSVAASLLARRVLATPDFQGLSDDLKKRHKKALGEDNYRILLRYDQGLETMADVIRRMDIPNPSDR